jgi:hypothetical protein
MSSRTGLDKTSPRDRRTTYQHARGRALLALAPATISEKRLYKAVDQGPAIAIDPAAFAPSQRGGGWGPFAEAFVRFNESAFAALDVGVQFAAASGGPILRLSPGCKTGAIPMRSAYTGQVAGGFVVRPRFGWPGVGRILSAIGWQATPEFIELPLVPGSGREVPAWVLAGPVLARLEALLRTNKRGYRDLEETLPHPRGRVLWDRYLNTSLVRGQWDRIPCRFPDLDFDPVLRSHVRWALRKIEQELAIAGGGDPVARALTSVTRRLLELVADVLPVEPRRAELGRQLAGSSLRSTAIRQGIEALGWIVDERGLGGGQEQDGLPWVLSLDRLWEAYVEAMFRREVAETGGVVKAGRLGETVFPLIWSDPTHRSLGHLVPDLVIHRGRSVQIVDAKYKAHLAELDASGWHRFADEARESHRHDLHQVLAYAALYEADVVTATLVYPLRRSTWEHLRLRGRDVARAELAHGGRRVQLELRGIPFGVGRDGRQDE